MKARKIAVVSDAVMPFNKGGKEKRIHYLTRELVRLGFQVDIYTMRWWDKGDTYVENGVTFHAIGRLRPLYAGSRRSIPQAVLFSVSCLKMIRYDYDILEVDHMPVFPLFSMKLVALVKRRPLYATWHEVWGKGNWQEYLGTYKGLLAYWLERASVLMPDHIIAVSEQTEQQLRNVLRYCGPITLIRNAVDVQQITAVQPAAKTVDVLYVGRLLEHKNVNLLVRAIAYILPEYPDVRCEIIGGGPEKRPLERLIKELGLAKNVRMRGIVPSNNDVIAQMKAAKVFVSPSSREGFGLTVLEALTCGSRVVTVNAPENAARFLVEPERGTVCELTAEALADALRTELMLAGSRPRAAVADEYDWSTSARKLSEAYAS